MTRALATIIIAVFIATMTEPANAATPQQRLDAQAAWMQSVLHVPVPTRPVVVGGLADNAGEASADGVIRLDPEYADGSPGAVYTRLHELAHVPGNAACWGESGSAERAVEEGIADALARDLWPAASRRFVPIWWGFVYESGYDQEVRNVRYAVRALTGGRRWGRPERLMLRVLWQQGCVGRTQMLAGVGR